MIICVFLLIILDSIQTLPAITCTSQCDTACTEKAQSQCLTCLQFYFQTYSISDKHCHCYENFEPAINLPDYCCPTNCKTCGVYGCVKCWNHAYIQDSAALQAVICQCQQNYYQNSNTHLCDCMSKQDPSNYYYDQQLDTCYKCPNNCYCSENGCVSCLNSTNRNIIINKYNISTCYCSNDLTETNQSCQCPTECECQNGKVLRCSPLSYRVQSFGKYVCSQNFVETNGLCTCNLSYSHKQIATDPNGNYVCVCNSKNPQLIAEFFQTLDQQCIFCFKQCICDVTGCHSCIENDQVYSIDRICYCKNNFSISYVSCECQNPFYLVIQPTLSTKPCYCLSEKYPSQYYYIVQSQLCLSCPTGCTCTTNGCISCPSNLLRVISSLSNNRSACLCQDKSFQTQISTCQCSYMYVYSNQTCICDVSKVNFTFQDPDKQTCLKCPLGCVCDSTGCSSCQNYILRSISTNSLGRYTCYCLNNTVETNGVCGCQYPYSYNKSSLACECVDPYYYNDSGVCVCKSYLNPSEYYYDSRANQCYACPLSCICNQKGCVECSPDSLRFTMLTVAELYICPCVTTAYFYNSQCISCSNNSYYYSGNCIECPQCETCDKRGCLSCPDDMYLYNYGCYCIYPILYNMAGVCTCPKGYYFNSRSIECLSCPKMCEYCFFNENSLSLECLSCNEGFNRINVPSDRCKCQEGYIQIFPISEYCCPIGCTSCDSTGCLACNQFSYKIISGKTCVCPPSMVEQNYICVCPTGSYLFDMICHQCPLNCKTCTFNMSILQIQCLSCSQSVNRNTSTLNCTCKEYFKETFPTTSKFCIDEYCSKNQINCTKCISPWIVDQYHSCICPQKTFFSYQSVCEPCSIIQGCLQCSTSSICYECDESLGYYLSFYKCIYVNVFSFVQTSNQEQIAIQFDPILKLSQIVSIDTVIAKPIYSKINVKLDQVIEPVIIYDSSFNLENEVITVKVKISTSYNDSILAITGNFNTVEGSEINYTFNIKTILVEYISPLTFVETLLIIILSGIGLGMGYVIYIRGYKHNQIIFLLQTLAFAAFKINDNNLSNIYFGYNLKFSYFNFGLNQIQKAIGHRNYFEQSEGNYHFLTTDANIFRNAGISLVLSFCNIIILTIKILLVFVNIHWIGITARMRHAKILFRSFEFVYKTTMYPVVYFSIQGLATWNRQSLGDQSQIHIANIFSITVLSVFFITTIVQNVSIVTSNFYKRNAVSEVTSCVLCSIGFVYCGQAYWIFLVIGTIILRDIGYYCLRELYLRDNSLKNLTNYLTTIMQIILITLMLFIVKSYAMITLLAITIIIQIFHAFRTISNYDRQRESDKERGYIYEEKSTAIQMIV